MLKKFFSCKVGLNATSDYGDMFYDDFIGVIGHGQSEVERIKTLGKTDFSYDLRACLELGAMFSVSKNLKYKKKLSSQIGVAAFAEYGLLNVIGGGDNSLVDEATLHNMGVKMNHIYTTVSRDVAIVNNLRAGVRVSFLLPIAEVAKRRKCMCIQYVNRKYSRRR